MIQVAPLTVDHLSRLQIDTDPMGRMFHFSPGQVDTWMHKLRHGRGFALVAEDGGILGAVTQYVTGQCNAIMGLRAGPRMVVITRQVRRMLDVFQEEAAAASMHDGVPPWPVCVMLPVGLTPRAHMFALRWLRLLGFRLADVPYFNTDRGVFMAYERDYARRVEPATIE